VGLIGLAVWVLCALLLALAWWRRRRSNRARLAQWDLDERMHEPPYVPWPGEDPLAELDDDERPEGPKVVN